MQIGITERGDASLDFGWVSKVENEDVDGAILITKNLTQRFRNEVVRLHNSGKQLIVHATCTGWGATWLEPNVPEPKTQIDNLAKLMEEGFPRERCVLRLDPVLPTQEGLRHARGVLELAHERKLKLDSNNESDLLRWNNNGLAEQTMRLITSVVDEPRWAKNRYVASGHEPCYKENSFFANTEQLIAVIQMFNEEFSLMELGFAFKIQLCCEGKMHRLARKGELSVPTVNFVQQGCVSTEDLFLMGLINKRKPAFPTSNYGCICLPCKTEMLEEYRRCANGCLYCCWKD